MKKEEIKRRYWNEINTLAEECFDKDFDSFLNNVRTKNLSDAAVHLYFTDNDLDPISLLIQMGSESYEKINQLVESLLYKSYINVESWRDTYEIKEDIHECLEEGFSKDLVDYFKDKIISDLEEVYIEMKSDLGIMSEKEEFRHLDYKQRLIGM